MQTTTGRCWPFFCARSKAARRWRPKSSWMAGAVAAGQHQPMIGRVVDAGVGIARDHDAGGDVAAGVGGGVMQRRQHAAEIDVLGVHLLLRRRALDQHRRLGIAERAADEFAHAAEVDAEGGFDIGLARQQVADHRHVVAVDLGEQQRRPAVELLHQAGDFEIAGRPAPNRSAAGRASAMRPSAERKRVSSTEFDRLNAVSRATVTRRHLISWPQAHGAPNVRGCDRALSRRQPCESRIRAVARLIAGSRCAARRRTSRSPGTPPRCR